MIMPSRYVLVLLFLQATNNKDLDHVLIASWKELNTAISSTMNDLELSTITFDAMQTCPEYRRVVDEGNKELFLAMGDQMEYTWVRLGGFFALQKRYPDLASSVALKILLSAKNPTSLVYDPLRTEISKPTKQTIFDKSFALFVVTQPSLMDALFIVNALVPFQNLYDWYHGDRHTRLPAIHEALVLGRLFDEHQTKGRPVSEKMRRRLKALANIPGLPRLAFVGACEDKTSERFRECMSMVLVDGEGDKFYESCLHGLIAQRREYIVSAKLSEKLDLSAARRKLLEGMLRRPKKDN